MQTPEISYQEYFEMAQNLVELIKNLEESICNDIHLLEKLPQRAPRGGCAEEDLKGAREPITEKKISCGVLVRADRSTGMVNSSRKMKGIFKE
jgi:hypothetical protein